MKNAIFISALFLLINVNAQSYLISFAGKGQSETVSTVKAENLTTGELIEINGTDILRLTPSTGIYNKNAGESTIFIYPNPALSDAFIRVIPIIPGNMSLTIYEISGRQIARVKSYLNESVHEFQVSNLNTGAYIVKAEGINWQCSELLLSRGASSGSPLLLKTGNNTMKVTGNSETGKHKNTYSVVDIVYSEGERLKFTGKSGNYSTVTTCIPDKDTTITFNFVQCTDIDNNNYAVVELGKQIWMAENLRTTHYRNFNAVNTTDPPTKDITGETYPKYQWPFDGNESNASIYGRLYTVYAAKDTRGLCPAGWHIPYITEWDTLVLFLGGASVGGGKLKETGFTHWITENAGASNETGFTALPGGIRMLPGNFNALGSSCYFWSRSDFFDNHHYAKFIPHNSADIFDTQVDNKYGLSVRCVKD